MGRFLMLGAMLLPLCFATLRFSQKIAPCESFYDYVCNSDQNGPNSLFVNDMKRRLFDDMLANLLNNESDFALGHIVKESAMVKENAFYSQKGEEQGARIAAEPFGANPSIYDDYQWGAVHVEFAKGTNNVTCRYPECHPYFQGIARGFMTVVDIYQTMDISQSTIQVAISQSDYPELPKESEHWNKDIYARLLNDMDSQFHSHMNMLIGRYFFETRKFPEKLWRDLDLMYTNIVSEMHPSIRNSSKLDEGEKEDLLHTLKVITPHFGLPELFTKKELLDDYFKIVDLTVKKGVAAEAYKKKSPSDRVKALAQMLQLAAKRFRAKNPTFVDDYVWTKEHPRLPAHSSALQFGSSVWFQRTSVFFFPSLIQAVDMNLPVGFKYGFIGTVIANDLFSVLERVHQTAQKHETQNRADDLVESATGACKTFFTDADIARIVFKVLQKARNEINSYPLNRQKRFSETSFNDREYFFIGLASRFCTADHAPQQTEGETKVRGLLEVSEKSQNLMRVNEITREMRQFAMLFQCSPTHTTPSKCGLIADEETLPFSFPGSGDEIGGSGEDIAVV